MSERAGRERAETGAAATGSAKRLGEHIQSYLKSSGLLQRKAFRDLPQSWPEIVGPELARGSRVLGVKRGTVMVEVSSPSVKHELDVFHKETILARIREKYPSKNVTAIKCVYP